MQFESALAPTERCTDAELYFQCGAFGTGCRGASQVGLASIKAVEVTIDTTRCGRASMTCRRGGRRQSSTSKMRRVRHEGIEGSTTVARGVKKSLRK
jgi:hypothetical protein